MNEKLGRLIMDYQNKVRAALKVMRKAGIAMPFNYAEWIQADALSIQDREEKLVIDKHGRGCTVHWNGTQVDFDFGDLGEIDGFDLWRLVSFAGKDLQSYGFEDQQTLEDYFKASLRSSEIFYSGNILYYEKNKSRQFAVDIDVTGHTDNLPHRDLDAVLVLYAHYFLAADLMRNNYEALENKLGGIKSRRRSEADLSIYLSSWLGFLATTCEGFKKLRMRILLSSERPEKFQRLVPKSDAIGRLVKKHDDMLRQLRNNIFHLRDDLSAVRDFFSGVEDRLEWALDLHSNFASFFSDYRVLCEVHYLTNDRRSESSAWS